MSTLSGVAVRGRDRRVPSERETCAVRIGLGYIKGLSADDAAAVVGERERGGPYEDLAGLASRSGASRDGLERLAWAGACAAIGAEDGMD